jgi:hypothetical protein
MADRFVSDEAEMCESDGGDDEDNLQEIERDEARRTDMNMNDDDVEENTCESHRLCDAARSPAFDPDRPFVGQRPNTKRRETSADYDLPPTQLNTQKEKFVGTQKEILVGMHVLSLQESDGRNVQTRVKPCEDDDDDEDHTDDEDCKYDVRNALSSTAASNDEREQRAIPLCDVTNSIRQAFDPPSQIPAESREWSFEDFFVHHRHTESWTHLEVPQLDSLFEHFVHRLTQTCEAPDIGANVLRFYNLTKEEIGESTMEMLRVKLKPEYHLAVTNYSLHYFAMAKLEEKTLECDVFNSKISLSHTLIHITYLHLVSLVRVINASRGVYETLNVYDVDQTDLSELSKAHQAVIHIGDLLRSENIKRHKEACYKQIIVRLYETEDGDRFYDDVDYTEEDSKKYTLLATCKTRAWHQHCELKTYIYGVINRHDNFKMWAQTAIESYSCLVEHFKHCSSADFEQIEPQREKRSFYNGILDLSFGETKFHAFLSDLEPPRDLVSCKFFPMEFPLEHFHATHWFHIPTPAFQKIMDDQMFPPHVQQVIYFMFGRAIYKLNEHDKCETILFGIGKSGVGKSSFGLAAKNFFPDDEVAVLSSNIERIFGLGAIYKKMFFLCNEVTKEWSLPRADTQSIIVGDQVQVAEKNKTAHTVRWDVVWQ